MHALAVLFVVMQFSGALVATVGLVSLFVAMSDYMLYVTIASAMVWLVGYLLARFFLPEDYRKEAIVGW